MYFYCLHSMLAQSANIYNVWDYTKARNINAYRYEAWIEDR